jgi:hypothetical protein
VAIAVLFSPSAMSAEQYNEATKRLEEAGAGTPAGRVYHVCFGPSDRLQVFDLWDSEENFDAFSRTLLPILDELGINSGEPEMFDVHNIMR